MIPVLQSYFLEYICTLNPGTDGYCYAYLKKKKKKERKKNPLLLSVINVSVPHVNLNCQEGPFIFVLHFAGILLAQIWRIF